MVVALSLQLPRQGCLQPPRAEGPPLPFTRVRLTTICGGNNAVGRAAARYTYARMHRARTTIIGVIATTMDVEHVHTDEFAFLCVFSRGSKVGLCIKSREGA